MHKRTTVTLLILAGLSATAEAGVITGRVVDSLGNGVAGVNIDADGSGGPTITNGGTDINGFFTTTITPDGVYDLIFEPPPPPTTTHLTKVLVNVNVTGTVNLGNVTLAPGVALTGRTVRASDGTPVAAVNLDVLVGGQDLIVPGDVTDALGQFSIAVPTGPIEVRFKTAGTAPPLLSPTKLDLSLSSSTNIGDVSLQPGLIVSAIVKRLSNGAAVVNADLDVIDTTTKAKLYTPGDSTDASGFVDVVVPAGTYDIEICPQFSNLLVATTLAGKVITANTFLGTVQLAGGVVLSGKVTDFLGNPVAKADVDLKDAATGVAATLCGDDTDAAGNYAVVVPTGTFDVKFEAPPQALLCPLTVFGVVVTGNKVQNGTLPQGAVIYCTSKPSSIPGCVPSIVAPCTASLAGGAGSSDIVCGPVPGGAQPGILVYTTNGAAATPANTPFGFLCIQAGAGFFRVVPPALPGGVPGTCTGSYTFDFGAYLAGPTGNPNLVPGASIDMQAWYRDPPNPGMANFSNAARFQLAP